jgi:pyruvate/2-oxoglutarate dehydrogenase complex dihydrolipoamide dehydrogenase (E3) component
MGSVMQDLIVIGGGTAGESAALLATSRGRRTTVIERGLVGGECAFFGCMPSKTLLYEGARDPKEEPSIRWERASRRRDAVIHREGEGPPDDTDHVRELEAHGVNVRRGRAAIVGAGLVSVQDGDADLEVVQGKAIVIAAGSEPTIPPIEGLDPALYWTSREAMTTRDLPSSLLIVGGGVIGLEAAQTFLRFGVRVTLVEASDRILPDDHRATSSVLTGCLQQEGLDLRTGREVVGVQPGGSGRLVVLDDGEVVDVSQILIAVGRHALDLRTLGAASVDAAMDEHGVARPDPFLRLGEGLYVAGDASAGWQFTHVAEHEGRLAAVNASGGEVRADTAAVPRVMFTDPPTFAVGMSVEQARARGLEADETTRRFEETSMGTISDRRHGHLTAVIDTERRILVGAFAACSEAPEVANEAALAIRLALPLDMVAGTPHAFPTVGREMALVYRTALESIGT